MKKIACKLLATGWFCVTAASAGTYTNSFHDPAFTTGVSVVGTGTVGGSGWVPSFTTTGLVLTVQQNSLGGVCNLDTLDTGFTNDSFIATFRLGLTSVATPADGVSFVFGPDVNSSSIFDEEGNGGAGTANSLVIEFDTYENWTTEAPAVDVRLYGTEILHTAVPMASMVNGQMQNVLIQLKRNGTLTVVYHGVTIYDNVYLKGWVPTPGNFGINARTGGLNEDCVIDNLVVTTTVAPASPVAPTITANPSNVTVAEASSTTLSFGFDGSAPLTFQWAKNGAPISGATDSALALTAIPYTDNNAKYKCTVTNPSGSVTTTEATLTVTPDSVPPTPVSAAAVLNGGSHSIGIRFNKALDLASATLLANYSLPGGSISSASYVPSAPGVVLTVSGLTVGNTYTVTVQHVANDHGDAMPSPVPKSFTVPPQYTLLDQDVGAPALPGSMTQVIDPFIGSPVYTVRGGGDDIWNNSDNFHYAYTTVTGDFDFVVNAQSLTGPDYWTKAELMARAPGSVGATPDGADPFVATMSTRAKSPSLDGRNDIEAQWRDSRAGGPGGGGLSPDYVPTFPHNWLRLIRFSGSNFTFKASPDGSNWTTINAHTVPADQFPPTLFIGLAVVAHNNGDLNGGVGVFSSFGTHQAVPVAITVQPPSSLIVTQDDTLSLSVSATGDPINYQWQKGGTDIPGATKQTLQIINSQPSDSGTYNVRVFNAANSIVSSSSAVTVYPDINPPAVAGVGGITRLDGVIEVGVTFNEPVNLSTLIQGNFSLSAGSITGFKVATNSFLTYSAVVLATTGLVVGNSYQVTVQNVRDLHGNNMPVTSVNFTVGPAKWAETGVPITPGQVVPVGTTGFDILNGGRQEWSTYDEITLAYVKKTNDFDVQVQVVYAEPGSKWTRVGLHARNALNVGEPSSDGLGNGTNASAYAQTHVNPNIDLADTGLWPSGDPNQPLNPVGNNSHEQNQRLTAGAATGGWGSPATAPVYPTWLRLKREGVNLRGFRSTDGKVWIDQGTTSLTDQQADMYVGTSLAVETGNIWNGGANTFNVWTSAFDPTYDRLMLAQFRNFTDFPVLTIARVAGRPTVTFNGVLQSALVVTGPYADVVGATSPYTTPLGPVATYYRVRGTLGSR